MTNYPVRGIYQHYKGAYYEVLDVARHSETEESLVVYRALYGEYGLWCRPLGMFMETVIMDEDHGHEDGNRKAEVARFRLVKAFP